MELILNSIDYAENRPQSGYSPGCELYFSIHDGFFPAEHWYDFAFQDLKNWLPRLISFGMKHADSCELPFMDGPYTIRLSRWEDGSVSGSFYQAQEPICSEQNVDMRSLLKSALSACRIYDRFLYENGKINQFTDESRMLKRLLDT